MNTTFGERLGRLMRRLDVTPHAIDVRLEALGLRTRNFTGRAVNRGTQDNIAQVFAHLAQWLGTSADYLVSGIGPEMVHLPDPEMVSEEVMAGLDLDAAPTRVVAVGPSPVPSPPPQPALSGEERTVLLMARQMGYKNAIYYLALARVEPEPGQDPRQTGNTLPPPGRRRGDRNGQAGEGA